MARNLSQEDYDAVMKVIDASSSRRISNVHVVNTYSCHVLHDYNISCILNAFIQYDTIHLATMDGSADSCVVTSEWRLHSISGRYANLVGFDSVAARKGHQNIVSADALVTT